MTPSASKFFKYLRAHNKKKLNSKKGFGKRARAKTVKGKGKKVGRGKRGKTKAVGKGKRKRRKIKKVYIGGGKKRGRKRRKEPGINSKYLVKDELQPDSNRSLAS